VPFERPSLSALVERVRSDLRSRLGLAGPLVRRAMVDVLGTAWAGAVHLAHGHLDWISKQIVPSNEMAAEFVRRWAALFGLYPGAATFASGTATATGTDGRPIPEDSILQGSNGATYRVTADAEIDGGEATISVESVEAGTAGNLAAGETLTFESPLDGVDSAATVDAGDGIAGGLDEGTMSNLLSRLLLRWQEPAQGGADQDYKAWALAVPGVTRAWVFPLENGPGTVVVRFVLDEQEGGIFPDGAAVALVQAALDAERPVTAEVTAVAPTPLAVAFTIAVTPNTTEAKNAVSAELADLLFREAEPGDGAGKGTIKLSKMLVAIGVAEGVEDFTLTVPAADVVPAAGELAVLGTITWT